MWRGVVWCDDEEEEASCQSLWLGTAVLIAVNAQFDGEEKRRREDVSVWGRGARSSSSSSSSSQPPTAEEAEKEKEDDESLFRLPLKPMRHTVRIRMVVVGGKNFWYTQRRFLYIYMYVFIPLLRPSSSFLDTIKEESMRERERETNPPTGPSVTIQFHLWRSPKTQLDKSSTWSGLYIFT